MEACKSGADGAGGEQEEGGGLGDGGWIYGSCLRGDGEVVEVGALDGVGQVDQLVGA